MTFKLFNFVNYKLSLTQMIKTYFLIITGLDMQWNSQNRLQNVTIMTGGKKRN